MTTNVTIENTSVDGSTLHIALLDENTEAVAPDAVLHTGQAGTFHVWKGVMLVVTEVQPEMTGDEIPSDAVPAAGDEPELSTDGSVTPVGEPETAPAESTPADTLPLEDAPASEGSLPADGTAPEPAPDTQPDAQAPEPDIAEVPAESAPTAEVAETTTATDTSADVEAQKAAAQAEVDADVSAIVAGAQELADDKARLAALGL